MRILLIGVIQYNQTRYLGHQESDSILRACVSEAHECISGSAGWIWFRHVTAHHSSLPSFFLLLFLLNQICVSFSNSPPRQLNDTCRPFNSQRDMLCEHFALINKTCFLPSFQIWFMLLTHTCGARHLSWSHHQSWNFQTHRAVGSIARHQEVHNQLLTGCL